ncbi:ATP-binding cassette domain-containing protein [Microbacterium kyungheense]|uniref:Peptide/nickel transport system ATP-binding protein n=1 Tax=Microbacterium kyungheense TaxID=1263636 RepID=A0A543FJE2_9MICO|nr:ABC transporter ATP-binding protein [Microbacterium kyungheense]TQM33834.1 peptide/nickel transport system ATP-binding protein [Microbacterium kyungheense]
MSGLVSVRGLTVEHRVAGGRRTAVDGVDLDIAEGEAHGLVGESGSGKSTIALALTRYLPKGARVRADQLRVAGRDVLSLDAAGLRQYRRDDIGVVFQEPSRALNPTASIGSQVAEAHRLRGLSATATRDATVASLAEVGLPDPERLTARYPHELSGGQQQRVMIAMALAARPRLLILDEPTTGLDSQVQAEVLALITRLQHQLGFASLLISHDLPLVAAHSDRVGVLERGRLLETTTSSGLVAAPAHDYTRRLVAAIPALDGPVREAVDAASPPLLVASGLRKHYGGHAALDGVDLRIGRGETLGIVGESGSGKTTLGRVVAGVTAFDGELALDAPTTPPPVQIVFQSPDASLNPRRTVRQTLRRAIELLHGDESPERLAAQTGLPAEVLDKLPHQLSGGQKQRVAIARAFAGRSPLIVCDEPTSALDVTVQATVIDLLIDLQERTGVSYLFISHDLAVVRRVSHRVAVMQRGRLVETASAAEIFGGARHPYTQSLIAAARLGRRDEPTAAAPA